MEPSLAADPLVGHLLDGRYRVGAKIARGGMATVYEATDLRLDRRVAVKVMPDQLTESDDFGQRFVREARAAARLTHPNVVAVYDQGDDHGTVFLVMEFVSGRLTLRNAIRDHAPIPPRRALALFEEILKAIAAAHESGIIHRDVKPENVLIDPRGQVKVADFGLARAITSATTATATGGVLMGTVSYISPEQVTEGHADARSDVYALGVVLYEMLTGEKPHRGDSPIQVAYRHVHHDVPLPSTRVDGIPPYLDAFVSRATSRHRDLRPADGHVMLRQLRRVRHALEQGVVDDEELTADLTPTVTAVIPRQTVDQRNEELELLAGDEREHRVPAHLAPAHDPHDDRSDSDDTDASAPDDDRGNAAPTADDRDSTATPETRRDDDVFDYSAYDDFAPTPPAPGHGYGVGRSAADSGNSQHGRHSNDDADRVDRTAVFPTIDEDDDRQGRVVAQSHRRQDAWQASAVPPSKRRKAGYIAFLLVILLAAGAAAAGWYYGVARYRDTPNVLDLNQSDAVDEMASVGLELTISGTAYSESVPSGFVISTDPGPGERVLDDGAVEALVSKGPERHDVPPLRGLSESAAIAAITDSSLTVGRTRRVWSETVTKGDVVGFGPDAGTPLRRDDEVRLVISRGPKPIKVVDFTGQPADTAESELEEVGFAVEVRERYHDTVPDDVVIRQQPDRGTGFTDDEVVLVVSLGPELISVPNVDTAGIDSAEQTLREAGFDVRVVKHNPYFGLGFVVEQSPAGDSLAPRGSIIEITVV